MTEIEKEHQTQNQKNFGGHVGALFDNFNVKEARVIQQRGA